MRRLFYIIFAIVLLIAIIVIVWVFFFSPNKGSVTPPKTNPFPEGFDVDSGFRLPNPFGKNEEKSDSDFEITKTEEQILTKLWDKPVAGYGFFDRQILEQIASTTVSGSTTIPSIAQVRATTSLIFFVDRTTGYIHQYDTKTRKISQTTNTLIPGVYDVFFIANGKYVIYRLYDESRDVVSSWLYRVPTTTSSSDPVPLEKITTLPDNVVSVAVNKKGNQFAFIAKNSSGGSLYVVTEDVKNSVDPFPPVRWVVTDLPVSEWNLEYGGGVLYMTSKASAYVPGYTIEVFSGRRVVSNRTGLVSIASGDEATVFSTMFSQVGLVSFITNRKTGQSTAVNIKTIASKCSFEGSLPFVVCGVPETIPLKKQGYPDDWYQGVAQFSDNLYRVGLDGYTSPLVFLKKESGGEDIDVVKPEFNNRALFMLFTNKKDGGLWLVDFGVLSGS